jgi:precorrin-6A/cobalt-precorrin-6A reductase
VTPLRTLILGGTTEASAIARALAHDQRFAPTLSLAGRTIAPVLPPIPYRIGGFGGISGLTAYLRAEAIAAIIDATHPFAAQITGHAHQAATACAIPHLRLDRPAWVSTAGDHWTEVSTTTQAATALGTTQRRVFLTIGQQELAPFCAAPKHHYIIRSVDPPPKATQPPDATIITARGPFTLDAEYDLLKTHRIDILVTKNAGSAATAAKLAAARRLSLPVIMIARPPTVPMATVATVEAALHWLADHAAANRRGV